MSPEELTAHQLTRLNELFSNILPTNSFYRRHYEETQTPFGSLDELTTLPFTFKDQLATDTAGNNFAANMTFDRSQYTRFHRTSGTHGKPLVVLDTAEDLSLIHI